MYSLSWFESFAVTVSPESNLAELSAIMHFAPPHDFPAILDVGCGIGRTASGLAGNGYDVTGIDINVQAISVARKQVPHARFVVLDQRDVVHLAETFDVVLILWNSIGFSTRTDDQQILDGLAGVIRPGGKLLLDLYHPGWLARNEQRGVRDARGMTVDRWLHERRSFHRITYADGTTDDIQFNVYNPDEMLSMLQLAGFDTGQSMTWWDVVKPPTDRYARYQIVCTRQ